MIGSRLLRPKHSRLPVLRCWCNLFPRQDRRKYSIVVVGDWSISLSATDFRSEKNKMVCDEVLITGLETEMRPLV